jgi:hypothetical protein
MVGGHFNEKIRQYITNCEALLVIIRLFPFCALSLQLEILKKLTKLVEEYQRNSELCRLIGLFSKCVNLLERVENDVLFGNSFFNIIDHIQ